ncbi:MAG: hypothetical protein K2X93_13635 [Candidatus Obscuribacterales bacterium]|nr:hypothetical protein [Candidatus Obscuribacterales bacterium]
MRYVIPLVLTFTLSFFSAARASAHVGSPVASRAVVVSAVGDGSDVEPDSYPRVAAMENALLGQSYSSDELDARLARLENKAFGKTSAQADLSDRTDELQQYVEKKLKRKLLQEDPDFRTKSDDASEPGQQPDNASNGSQQANDACASQQPNDYETPDAAGGGGERSQGGSPNRARSVGTMIGTTLLNVAGLGVPGFGGVRVRNRADLPQQEQAAIQANQHQEPQEEAAVFEKEAPPATAKLLTKVGWCEMQVWNRTFPSMHLPQRLAQLNEEIKFAPGKTGVALMDCSAAMIEAASRHQAPR